MSEIENKAQKSVTKKELLAITVLLNLALLTMLFAMGSKKEPELLNANAQNMHVQTALVAIAPDVLTKLKETGLIQTNHVLPSAIQRTRTALSPSYDELDAIVEKFASSVSTIEESAPILISQAPVLSPILATPKSPVITPVGKEVVVKKGDILGRIASREGVTVTALMKANNLQSHQLKEGQVLKIPTSSDSKVLPKTVPKQVPAKIEPEYYVIKSGDNPWKIAKRFNIEYEKLLELNSIDEAKARNLKIGQKIRIR